MEPWDQVGALLAPWGLVSSSSSSIWGRAGGRHSWLSCSPLGRPPPDTPTSLLLPLPQRSQLRVCGSCIAPAPGLRTPPRSIPRGSAQPTRGRESAVPPSLWGAGVEEQQRATHSSWLQLRGPQGVRYSVSFGLSFFFFLGS